MLIRFDDLESESESEKLVMNIFDQMFDMSIENPWKEFGFAYNECASKIDKHPNEDTKHYVWHFICSKVEQMKMRFGKNWREIYFLEKERNHVPIDFDC